MKLPGGWGGRQVRFAGRSPGTSDATNFAAWRISYGIAGSEPGADVDFDGRPNIVEYLQNTDPRTADDYTSRYARLRVGVK